MSISPLALCVHLVRDRNNQSQDDYVKIRRKGDNFLVNYHDPTSSSKNNMELLLSQEDFVVYVKNLCKLFLWDRVPFLEIQFNFLGFPTFLASHDTFNKDPKLLSTLTTIARLVSDSVFAEDDTDYDDMPPLIPASSLKICLDSNGSRTVTNDPSF